MFHELFIFDFVNQPIVLNNQTMLQE